MYATTKTRTKRKDQLGGRHFSKSFPTKKRAPDPRKISFYIFNLFRKHSSLSSFLPSERTASTNCTLFDLKIEESKGETENSNRRLMTRWRHTFFEKGCRVKIHSATVSKNFQFLKRDIKIEIRV